MRRALIVLLVLGSLASPAFAEDQTDLRTVAEAGIDLRTEKDRASYSIGFSIGSNFKRQSMDIDLNLLLRGMEDALGEGEALLSAEERREVMTAFQARQRKKMEEMQKGKASENRKIGDRFLAENREKPGVVSRISGLQYKVIVEGDGATPTGSDTVKTHYRGRLIDGKEFDSSYRRGRPATFPVNGVIKGWTEALQLMKVGSKWELYIPSDLAYGERGSPPNIGPNETLIFEIELLGVEER